MLLVSTLKIMTCNCDQKQRRKEYQQQYFVIITASAMYVSDGCILYAKDHVCVHSTDHECVYWLYCCRCCVVSIDLRWFGHMASTCFVMLFVPAGFFFSFFCSLRCFSSSQVFLCVAVRHTRTRSFDFLYLQVYLHKFGSCFWAFLHLCAYLYVYLYIHVFICTCIYCFSYMPSVDWGSNLKSVYVITHWH